MSVEDIVVGAWINGTRMTDLRFADDIAVLAENATDLQEAVDGIINCQHEDGYADQHF